jgi:hypothetical protein
LILLEEWVICSGTLVIPAKACLLQAGGNPEISPQRHKEELVIPAEAGI